MFGGAHVGRSTRVAFDSRFGVGAYAGEDPEKSSCFPEADIRGFCDDVHRHLAALEGLRVVPKPKHHQLMEMASRIILRLETGAHLIKHELSQQTRAKLMHRSAYKTIPKCSEPVGNHSGTEWVSENCPVEVEAITMQKDTHPWFTSTVCVLGGRERKLSPEGLVCQSSQMRLAYSGAVRVGGCRRAPPQAAQRRLTWSNDRVLVKIV